MADDAVDRSKPPAPAPPRPFAAPVVESTRLAGGLRVLISANLPIPVTSLQLLLPAGGIDDPPQRPGLAAFSAALLEEGTSTHNSQQIAEIVERHGGGLASGAGWNVGAISLSLLSPHLQTGIDLLHGLYTDAAFRPDDVEKARRDRLSELVRRRVQPGFRAREVLLETLYAGTVYGTPLIGTRTVLEEITRDELWNFHRARRGAAGCTLLAVGSGDPSALLQTIESAFGDCEGGAPPAPKRVEPPTPVARRVRIVDRPKAAQTELRIGHPGPPRTHPDHVALRVMNSILGGKFTSRINLNLREQRGYTYGAHSSFEPRLGPGPFVVRTATANESVGAACREVLGELERLQQEEVLAAELEDSKSYMIGVLPYTLQTASGLAARLQEMAIYDLPADFLSRDIAAIEAVDAGAIRQAAQEHLRPELAAIVAVGPAAVLAPSLEGLGELEILPARRPGEG